MEYPTYLIHYGTLGQKWGVRKYQNEDGTWTEEGLARRRQENQKDLYKSIKRDVKRGTFDPKKYTQNDYVKSTIKNSNLESLIQKRDKLKKIKEDADSEEEKYNKFVKQEQDLADKYYAEMKKDALIKAEKEGREISDEEDFNLREQAEYKAEDEFNFDRWKETYGTINYNKFLGRDEVAAKNAYPQVSANAALEFDNVADKLIGKYSNKNISSLKIKNNYRVYVNDIIAESVNDTNWKEHRYK